MSLKAVLSPYLSRLDERDSRRDPEATAVLILLIHHVGDLQEAVSEGKTEAADAAIGDIVDILQSLGKEDFRRMEVVFKSFQDYITFRDDLDEILKFVPENP